MSNRHLRTLEAIFRDPVSATIVWADVEAMLRYYGAVVREGRGSRLSVRLNGVYASFHRPHPHKEASRPMIRKLRQLLTQANQEPAE